MTFSVLFDCIAEEKEECKTTLTLFNVYGVKLSSCTSTPFGGISTFEPWHVNVLLYIDMGRFSATLFTVPLMYLHTDQLRRLYSRRRRYAMRDYVTSRFDQNTPSISLYINSKEGGEIFGEFTLFKDVLTEECISEFRHGAFLTSFSFVV